MDITLDILSVYALVGNISVFENVGMDIQIGGMHSHFGSLCCVFIMAVVMWILDV